MYPAAESAAEMEAELEEDARYKFELAKFPFYGAFRLPADILRYTILENTP
jgi:hypothetical protein